MRYCQECGTSLEVDMRFCEECGRPIELVTRASHVHSQARKPLSKKTKRWMIISSIVIVLFIGAYKLGNYLTSKERLVDRFETALLSEDTKELASLLSTNDPELTINEDSLKGFFTYLDQYPDERQQILHSIKAQLQEDHSESESGHIVTLDKENRFLYDQYSLTINPVYVTIQTNYENTILYINDKEVAKSNKPDDEKTVGPYLPGIYTLRAQLETDSITLEKEEEITLEPYEEKSSQSIYLDAEDVTVVVSGITDGTANLIINGNDTGVNILKQNTFGPVLMDGSMLVAVELETPWGMMKTVEKPIEQSQMELKLSGNEQVQKEIMETIILHTKQVLEATATGSTKGYTVATEELKHALQNEINDAKETGKNSIYSLQKTVFDVDSLFLYQEDNGWKVNILVAEHYQGDEFRSWEEPKVRDVENINSYQMLWQENQKNWVVEDINSVSRLSSEKVKEFVEKDPKVYKSNWGEQEQESKAATNSTNVPDDIQELMDNYIYSLIDAINTNDFSKVAPYLIEKSDLYTMQKDLVNNLAKQNIKEEMLDYKITDLFVEGGVATIWTWEKAKIINADGSTETKEYNWVYDAAYDENGNFGLMSIRKQ
ncbi:hypothetical protein CJ195_11205 [Bacillus sp. UMB0899]|nr:hypothetical protein CJ195_11205 [Bacillus sp. UMB0899]